ncbi:uncharacterized protein SRS1_17604 [Sporisorium reilianum f. sp. reilianum]|uniref:Uncharacterized protein n=1 Tax=Sporisorium reilianum f. sp. reilianum TaxID=72559 RepID=A0A2N8UI61_9BASI|nr:uncharacterized protein SRS1_17604 [Sporisorium reilianum f. sp. reilianum]
MPPSSSLPTSLLQAIAEGTTHGRWGDVCFVVKALHDDRSYAVLCAHLSVLRASGAHHLADEIERTQIHSVRDALAILRRPRFGTVSSIEGSSERTDPTDPTVWFYPVKTISYTTLRVILIYLQTGFVSFVPLDSPVADNDADDADDDADDEDDMNTVIGFVDVARMAAPTHATTTGTTGWPGLSASPKAVYRAARKFRLDELRKLAIQTIDDQITPANCLVELFSLFGLKYREVFDRRLRYVLDHWNEIPNRDQLVHLVNSSRLRSKATAASALIMEKTTIQRSA